MILAGCIACAHAWPVRQGCEHEPSRWLRLESYEHVGVCALCPEWTADWDAAAVTHEQVKRGLDALALPVPAGGKILVLPKYGEIAARLNQRIAWFEAQKGAK